MSLILRTFARTPVFFALSVSAVLLTACAQSPLSDTQSGRGSTQTDALKIAQGRDALRANSQLQFGLDKQDKPLESEQLAKTSTNTFIPELKEAKTFLGTLPCAGADTCALQKLTVTLAPTGQWRLRAQTIDAQGQTISESGLSSMGCWVSTAVSPRRIILLNAQDTVMADLSFSNNNVLLVNSYNQQRPTLSTSLTRQADIDPIDELDTSAAPACS
ncbi:hypothetical protein [Alcaligenes endophyticus]|uniref:Copper resistance protein NlpE n=1 Tax=Alcaligenes endophyticus TaxID=1929088 RepID=A0ABT8EG37_9BURK|nr:hypothetical protein [Alcaligenes endophyticus]MCX5590084.1 hypothetical protein [Alcaligenes endophyticus]MDN4120253.1 copper resistance protein NlpE [Alcaligenes endophyticus]